MTAKKNPLPFRRKRKSGEAQRKVALNAADREHLNRWLERYEPAYRIIVRGYVFAGATERPDLIETRDWSELSHVGRLIAEAAHDERMGRMKKNPVKKKRAVKKKAAKKKRAIQYMVIFAQKDRVGVHAGKFVPKGYYTGQHFDTEKSRGVRMSKAAALKVAQRYASRFDIPGSRFGTIRV